MWSPGHREWRGAFRYDDCAVALPIPSFTACQHTRSADVMLSPPLQPSQPSPQRLPLCTCSAAPRTARSPASTSIPGARAVHAMAQRPRARRATRRRATQEGKGSYRAGGANGRSLPAIITSGAATAVREVGGAQNFGPHLCRRRHRAQRRGVPRVTGQRTFPYSLHSSPSPPVVDPWGPRPGGKPQPTQGSGYTPLPTTGVSFKTTPTMPTTAYDRQSRAVAGRHGCRTPRPFLRMLWAQADVGTGPLAVARPSAGG